MTRPDSTLKEPQASDPMPFMVSYLAGGNFISPAFYVSELLKKTLNLDIFGWASQHVTGDWEGVQKAAEAAANLGRFNGAYSRSITDSWQQTAGATWNGHAAGTSEAYFKNLSATLDFQVRPLEEIHRQLTNISTGMRELGRLVGDILQDLADKAIILGITQAAAAAAAATGVGVGVAAAEEAAAAAIILQIIKLAQKLVDLVSKAYKTIYGTIGLLNSLSSQTRPENLPPLPTSSYDFPGA